MPYDALLMFSASQALLATANSTNTLDFGQTAINPRSPTGARFPQVHNADEPDIVIKVEETFAGSTALSVALQGSNDDSTFVTLATVTPTFADLKAGFEFGIGVKRNKRYRYERLVYTVTGTGTAGKLTAGYNDGYQTAGTV